VTGAELQARTDALVEAQALRDAETHGHVERVARLSLRLGRAMGLSAEELEDLRIGALLHDLGKLSTPDHVLRKPGKHDDEETFVMRLHAARGAAALERLGFPAAVVRVVAEHHERWDGGGYPVGLRWAEISLLARIFSVADTLDAILSNRCYRRGNTFEAAEAELVRFAGTQFDPAVVDAFRSVPREVWLALAGARA
jgi:putative nucleotidyltransferase with HDIG domain